MHLRNMRGNARRAGCALGAATLVAMIGLAPGNRAHAAVTAVGDVSPAPPAAGGNVAAPFRVGITGVGTLGVTAGTPVTVTGGSAIIGDSATGVGIVQLTGLGSNLSTANDLTIGNDGTGSVSAGQFGRITLTDDLFMATGAASSGDLFVDGLGTLVDVADSLVIGGAGNAIAQVTAGGRIDADDSVLGQFVGSDGRVTISGNASTLSQTNSMTIGESGRGELQVISQGTVLTTNVVVANTTSGTGVAVVNGVGSIWKINGFLNLGVGGLATLNVLDGAQASTTGTLRMATASTSESHAVLNGANALLAVGTTVTVGESGFGTLDVRGGAHMTSTSAVIGDNAGSRGEVLVDGIGSLWKITGTLDVSDPGEAQLAITGGGRLTASGAVRIAANGRLIMSTGRLEAGGLGLTNNGVIQGAGRITGNVTNSATGSIRLSPGNAIVMANTLTNAGLIDLDGSELETLGATINNSDIDARNANIRFGGMGLDNNAGAQLAITLGSVDVFGAVDNNAGAEIAVVGGATGVFHDAVTNNGTIFVSASSEIVLLDNLGFVPTSTLGIQLAQVDPLGAPTDAFGLVDVSGSSTLAGTLAVSVASGFSAAVGDTYEILRASGGLTGAFSTETLPTLGGGLSLDVQYTPTSVLLAVVGGSFSADFDGDNDVDGADLAIWKGGFGVGNTHGQGDADGDSDVDGADLLVWQKEQSGAPSAAVGSPVPEPAGVVLVLVGLASQSFARRQRRDHYRVVGGAAVHVICDASNGANKGSSGPRSTMSGSSHRA